MSKTTIWDNETQGTPPPGVLQLIGKTVKKAWAGKTDLYLEFYEGQFAIVEPRPTEVPGRRFVLVFNIGDIKPGAKFNELDSIMPPIANTRQLKGKKVTGLDGDTLVFDYHYGVQFALDQIHWVQTAQSLRHPRQ